MATTTLPGLFDSGDHASRPAASAVGSGALYACSTHALIYQSDGSSWSTWATLGGGANVEALPTAETDTSLVLAPDGVGGVEFRAEAGGGGGGLTQAYAGYNTIGGTSVAPTDFDHVVQKITLANDCELQTIDLYLKNNAAAQTGAWHALLYDDVAGKPVHLLTAPPPVYYQTPFNLYRVSGTAGDARWFSAPIGRWLSAGDYWIGFHWASQGAQHLVYYDATGTGYKWSAGGNAFVTDAPDTSGTVYTLTPQSRTYSIRASTIR